MSNKYLVGRIWKGKFLLLSCKKGYFTITHTKSHMFFYCIVVHVVRVHTTGQVVYHIINYYGRLD